MHSFHHSRGRIFFEVLCALGMSASFVGAWTQTGASALLPAAAVALLYGLVHMFDMFRRRPAAPKPEAVEVAAEQPVAAVQPVLADPVPEVTELAEPAPLPARKARQPKASRKKAKAAEVARAEEGRTVEIVPDDDFFCDRSLRADPFLRATGYQAPSWNEMLSELAGQIRERR